VNVVDSEEGKTANLKLEVREFQNSQEWYHSKVASEKGWEWWKPESIEPSPWKEELSFDANRRPVPQSGPFRVLLVAYEARKSHLVNPPLLIKGALWQPPPETKEPGNKEQALPGTLLGCAANNRGTLDVEDMAWGTRDGNLVFTYLKPRTVHFLFFLSTDVHEYTLLPMNYKPIRLRVE
jgi:hypothetical protein